MSEKKRIIFIMRFKISMNRTVGRLMKELRQKNNLSQEKLALESGMDRTYISLLERGKRTPSLYSIYLLCQRLGISLSEFTSILETQLDK